MSHGRIVFVIEFFLDVQKDSWAIIHVDRQLNGKVLCKKFPVPAKYDQFHKKCFLSCSHVQLLAEKNSTRIF